MRAKRIALVVALLAMSRATAETHYLAVDTPATLGTTTFTPGQIVVSTDGAYALLASLPAGTEISALHRRSDGVWLLSLAAASSIGTQTYEPRDVVAFDGVAFSPFLTGASVGIPPAARIDALFQNASGDTVMSFDVPVHLGSSDYGPSDLVRYHDGFSSYWVASVAGVPSDANVSGAATTPSAALVVSFGTPTRLAGVDYLPGQLVRWNGGTSFVSYAVDPAWPPSNELRDFAFPPACGAVPDGGTRPGTPLTMTRGAMDTVTLSWGTSCASGDTDYEIYEGAIGSYSSYSPAFCTTAGATSKTFSPPPGSTFFIVVPRNGVDEGSYGVGTGGSERHNSPSACVPQMLGACS